jgi:hypothetical protein
MKFYTVVPKSKESYSRRWFVDEVGVKLVEKKYTNYEKVPGQPVNRWGEFKIEPTDKVWFDFGGMMHKNTPVVKETLHGVEFSMPVTHVDFFLEALDNPELNDPSYWQCPMRFWCAVFSPETKSELKKIFTEKSKLYEEMIEGFNKDMDDALEAGRKAGRIIGMKKYHKDKHE